MIFYNIQIDNTTKIIQWLIIYWKLILFFNSIIYRKTTYFWLMNLQNLKNVKLNFTQIIIVHTLFDFTIYKIAKLNSHKNTLLSKLQNKIPTKIICFTLHRIRTCDSKVKLLLTQNTSVFIYGLQILGIQAWAIIRQWRIPVIWIKCQHVCK